MKIKKNYSLISEELIDFPNNSELFISASINDHIIKREDEFPYSEYILYKINFSCRIKKWKVYKRYSDFENFYNSIKIHFMNLPKMPKKRFFNFSNEIILERKFSFLEIINFLIRKEIIVYSEFSKAIQNFIYIEENLINLLCDKQLLNFYENSYLSEKTKNYFNQYLEYLLLKEETSLKSPFMKVIEEFLRLLEENLHNKSSIIKSFDTFMKYKKNWPIFFENEIEKLIFGEYENDDSLENEYKLKGLIYHIGNIDKNNEYGSEESLYFFVKLIDCEYNPEFEKYISIIVKKMTHKIFSSMNLKYHFNKNKSKLKVNILKLIGNLIFNNSFNLKEILKKDDILSIYENYHNEKIEDKDEYNI